MSVDLLANGGTGSTTRCPTEQRAHECAEDRANGTSDQTKGSAGFGTTERGGCSGSCTDCTAGFAGIVASGDARRVAARTGKEIVHISVSCGFGANALPTDSGWMLTERIYA